MAKLKGMYWDRKNRRWMVQYRGKNYAVSCRQLGCEKTKEASQSAAREWWDKKRAQVDLEAGGNHPHAESYDKILRTIGEMIQWAEDHCESETASRLRNQAERLRNAQRSTLDPPWMIINENAIFSLSNTQASHEDFMIPSSGNHSRLIWQDRLGHVATIPQPKTIEHNVEKFLSQKEDEVENRELTAGRFDNIRRALDEFMSFFGRTRSLSNINGETLIEFRQQLLKSQNLYSARDKFGAFKQFLNWAYETERLDSLPRNFRSKSLNISIPEQEIKYWTIEEFRQISGAAVERTKLFLLLMVNCGMYQKDISDLKPVDVDWDRGRIKRKRSKMERHASARLIDYTLWPITHELLLRYGRRNGKRVFLTEDDTPLVVSKLVNRKQKRWDNIRSAYYRVCDKLGIEYDDRPNLKSLRKTSAKMLADQFGENFALHFLAQSPRSVMHRHYVMPEQDDFDNALLWLLDAMQLEHVDG